MLSHIGIDPERLQFSWISSAESTKFIDVVTEVVESVRKVGPNTRLVKNVVREP